jgi:hypothetical protein
MRPAPVNQLGQERSPSSVSPLPPPPPLALLQLERAGAHEVGVVLKIETRAGFENLPATILTALRRPKVGRGGEGRRGGEGA